MKRLLRLSLGSIFFLCLIGQMGIKSEEVRAAEEKNIIKKVEDGTAVARVGENESAVAWSAHLPAGWQADWENPKNEHRPLQILHGWLRGWTTQLEPATWDFSTFTQPGGNAPAKDPKQVSDFFKKLGFGGVVCNVGGEQYFRDENEWDLLVHSVKTFDKAGLRVWIYDEQGYPSLGAGGLVLEKNPKLESQALVYDSSLDKQGKDPFLVRPAFEYTHAANNVRVLRRYPNPLVPESTRLFIDCTHEEYRRRLGDHLFNRIEAFFTDEPSIIAFNLSRNPGKTLPSMQAKINMNVKALPMVPWAPELPALYEKEYKSDLIANRKSLFTGDTEKDKTVRLQFWTLVGKLDCESYYGQIRNYLDKHGSSAPTITNPDAPLRLAFSGHLLGEESLIMHLACDGNKIANTMKMNVPGLDVLSSRPERRDLFTAAFPCSAAFLAGNRLVMTEVSDMADFRFRKPFIFASYDMMMATAVWQAVWGVTEFASYYRFENQGKETFKKYGDFIGRLNAVLRKAKPVRPVLVYNPVEEMQKEFRPYGALGPQNKRCNQLIKSFRSICTELTKNQIPFTIIDRTRFDMATRIESNGPKEKCKQINLNGLAYDCILLPENVEWSSDAIPVIRADQPDFPAEVQKLRQKLIRLEPQNQDLVGGQFERDGKTIWLFGNMNTKESWQGKVVNLPTETCCALDPSTGRVYELKAKNGQVSLELPPMQSLLLIDENKRN